jgi:hypothetical protein
MFIGILQVWFTADVFTRLSADPAEELTEKTERPYINVMNRHLKARKH